MTKEYVTQIDGAYRITGSRVSLDSIVYAWIQGQSPETIADNFPALTLEEVYGAVTFYLSNRDVIDDYLRRKRVDFEALRASSLQQLQLARPHLHARLMAAKQQRAASALQPELLPQ
jgi:uncharacterized protein (DUF433 family)